MGNGLNLLTIRTAFREYIDDRNFTRFGNDQALAFINRGQEAIQNIIDDADENFFSSCQQYIVQPSSDSYEFTLPVNFKKVILVERVVTGDAPVKCQHVDFRRRHEDSGYFLSGAYPGLYVDALQYYLRGDRLGVVAPGASCTIRVWYTYQIPDLSSDTDKSEIPKEYCNLVALHAAILSKGERVGNAGALPDELVREYEQGVERLKAYIEARCRQSSRSVIYEPEY